jgi:small-conductance mechanosensitive channel
MVDRDVTGGGEGKAGARVLANGRSMAGVLAALLVLGAPLARAEDTGAGEPRKAKRTSADLVVYNRHVATFRGVVLGMSPEERVARSSERIQELLSHPGKHEISTRSTSIGQVVAIDGSMAYFLTPEDLDPLREETLEEATRRSVQSLAQIDAETREARDVRALLQGALYAAVATAVFLLLVWGARRLRRAITDKLGRLAETHAHRLKLGGAELLSSERLSGVVRWLVAIVTWTFLLLLAYEWIGFVLGRFPYTRPWGERLVGYLGGLVATVGLAIVGAVPGLVLAAVIFILARFCVEIASNVFDRVKRGALTIPWLDADTVAPTRRIVNVVIWLFAVAMAYPYLPGAGTEAFKGLSVLVGLMISLGASSVVGQGAAGLILMYTRTLRPGEYVRINDFEGTVVESGLFITRILTGLGEELTLSNALVVGAVTKNYSRAVKGPGFVLDTVVTIGYDAPWRQVEAMLLEAARRTEGVIQEPPSRVHQTALSDFYVEYRLVTYAVPTRPVPRALLLSALHAHIQDVFNEYGVQIMSPHYLGDPEKAKVVPRSEWHTPPARPPEGGSGGTPPAA